MENRNLKGKASCNPWGFIVCKLGRNETSLDSRLQNFSCGDNQSLELK